VKGKVRDAYRCRRSFADKAFEEEHDPWSHYHRLGSTVGRIREVEDRDGNDRIDS